MTLLTYDEFAKLVPKETLEFVNATLPMIRYYEDSRIYAGIVYPSLKYEKDQVLAIFLHTIYKISPKYASLLTKYGYDDTCLDFSNFNNNYSLAEIFQDYCSYFCCFNFLYNYQALTPADIINNLFNKYLRKNFFYNDVYVYKFCSTIGKICNKQIPKAIYNLCLQETQEITNKLKMIFNSNLSIEIINYLETTSKIHQILEESKTNEETPSYITSEKDIVVISLFLALFYSKNTKEQFKNYFHHIGINEQAIQNSLNIENLDEEIEKTQENYLLLQLYYSQYKDENIKEILKKLIDREQSQSVALEVLLNNLNQDMSVIKNLTNKELLEKIENTTLLDTFPPQVKTYLENAVRIHSRLHKHITNTTSYNLNLINQKEDIIL